MLSPERLKDYSDAGITDIYVEEIENNQHIINQLAAGEIGHDTFIGEMNKTSENPNISKEEYLTQLGNFADAIIAGAKMTPPIRFHAAQMSNTREQKVTLAIIDKKIHHVYDKQINDIFKNVLKHSGDFLETLKETGDEHRDSDLYVIYGTITPIFQFDDEVRNEKIAFDPHSILKTQFGGRVPDKLLNDFADKLRDLNKEQLHCILDRQICISDRMNFDGRSRIDNDDLLVQKIIDTKDPAGRAIVIHGAGHGAERPNDLDDQLQKKGFSVNRVNIVYNNEDLKFLIENYPDPSDMSYYPREDIFKLTDHNRDGIVNGSHHDTYNARPPDNSFENLTP